MKTFSKFIFLELSNKITKDLETWMEENPDLPFDYIFGDNYRISFPITTDKVLNIVKELENKGYKVDLKSGVVERPTKNRKIIPKNTEQEKAMLEKGFQKNQDGSLSPPTQEKGSVQKIGKAIKQEFGDKTLKEFEKEKEFENHDGSYSVIISRHPIDVARMSDFDGIKSCHSQGKDYFKCAISDAKGHGSVAYLVSNSELKKIKNLQDKEIFYDKERGISGATPSSRLRLRRFVDGNTNKEFPVPEERMYGNKTQSFLTAVTEFAKEHLPFKTPPNFDDLYRTGGSYSDTNAGKLLNSLFGDDDLYPNRDVNYQGEEDDYTNLGDQYEEELEAFTDSHQRRFHHENIFFDASVEATDEYVNIYPYFSIIVPLAGISLNKKFQKDMSSGESWKRFRGLNGAMNGIIDEHYSFEMNSNYVDYYLEVTDIDNPDDWNAYLSHALNNYSDKYNQIVKKTYEYFYENGYAEQPKANNSFDEKLTYKNFKIDRENHVVTITSNDILIGKDNDLKQLEPIRKGFPVEDFRIEPLKNELIRKIHSGMAASFRAERKQQVLPGFDPKEILRSLSFEKKAAKPDIVFIVTEPDYLNMRIVFELPPIIEFGKIKGVLNYIRYLDNNMNTIAIEAQKLFKSIVFPKIKSKNNF